MSDPSNDYSMDKSGSEEADTSNVIVGIEGKNGDAEVNLRDKPYAGMEKRDLLRFSQTTFWRRFRNVLLAFFLIAWLVLVAASVAFIVVFPRCQKSPNISWWQSKTLYKIYTRSFLDSDGDGNGDLKGIESKIDYLEKLNVGAVLLSPIYPNDAPTDTGQLGFRIKNFVDIDPMYGSIADFESLVKKLHESGIKVVLDFVPNHTGNNHKWFSESRKAGAASEPFRNYYIWQPCNKTGPKPNNWLSVYGGSAWTYDDQRKACYLHQFSPEEPDLNLRNNAVMEDLMKAVRFWLEKGVDGFNLLRSEFGFEDYDLKDDGTTPETVVTDYWSLRHENSFGRSENVLLPNRIKKTMSEFFNKTSGRSGVVFVDSVDPKNGLEMYGTPGIISGADLVFIPSSLADGQKLLNGKRLASSIKERLPFEPDKAYPTSTFYFLEKLEIKRSSLKTIADANILKMLGFMLGTPVALYGNEIGLPASTGKNSAFHPMQWNNSTKSGFTSGSPWIALGNEAFNVADQENKMTSPLSQFRKLSALRKEASLQYGRIHIQDVSADVLYFVREADGKTGFMMACNFGSSAHELKTADFIKREILPYDEIEAVVMTSDAFDFKEGDKVKSTNVKLPPQSGVVFKWKYQKKNHL